MLFLQLLVVNRVVRATNDADSCSNGGDLGCNRNNNSRGTCVMTDIAQTYPSGNPKVRSIQTGQFLHRQKVLCHSDKPPVQDTGDRTVAPEARRPTTTTCFNAVTQTSRWKCRRRNINNINPERNSCSSRREKRRGNCKAKTQRRQRRRS